MSTPEKAAPAQPTSQSASPTNQSPPAASAIGGALQLKASLRGHDFATQVQMLAPENAGSGRDASVHAAAARGTGGSGGKLPYGDQIQRSFGGYDISNVQAHSDAAAMGATAAMGAAAYATGNHVVLGQGGQDLHTVAHEAAHVVQQRHGVSLSGGVGTTGDPYEQHADAVADLVVQGKSAEGLLGQMAGGGTGQTGHGVQMSESKFESRHSATVSRAGSDSKPDTPTRGSSSPNHETLQDVNFNDGAALLTPRDAAAPVQKRAARVHGNKGVGWTPEQTMTAYQATRLLGWNPEWVKALQMALGVEPKGIASRELADAVAELEAANGRVQTGRIDGVNTVWLEGLFPALAATPRMLDDGGAAPAGAAARRLSCPEDGAMQKMGVAPSYAAYAASVLRLGSFCGHPVTAHPTFLARLRAAEAWLSTKNGGLAGDQLGAKLGVTEVSSYRPNTGNFDNLLHGIGFAIDVNPKANNWNFGTANQGRFTTAMANASALLGVPNLIKVSQDLGRAAKGKTTEETFEEISVSNEALRRYRAFALNKPALEAWLASENCPAAAKAKGLAYWWRTVTADHKRLVARTGPSEGDRPAGFMDYEQQMVTALRDAAGLRWGGTDFGGDLNGDLMHFDAYDLEPGKKLRDLVRDARKKAGEPST